MERLPTEPTPLLDNGLKEVLKNINLSDDEEGKIEITAPEGKRGEIYLKGQSLYAVHYASFTPPLILRLKTAGYISPQLYSSLKNANVIQIHDFLKTTDKVGKSSVETINLQMLLSSLSHISSWTNAKWEWKEGEITEYFTIMDLEKKMVLTALEERAGQWNALERNYPEVTNPKSIPMKGKAWKNFHTEGLTATFITVIKNKINNRSTTMSIARSCGLTRFELATLLAKAQSEDLITFTKEKNNKTSATNITTKNDFLEDEEKTLPSLENIEQNTPETPYDYIEDEEDETIEETDLAETETIAQDVYNQHFITKEDIENMIADTEKMVKWNKRTQKLLEGRIISLRAELKKYK